MLFSGIYGKEGFYTGDKGKTIKKYSKKEITKALLGGSKLQRVSDPGRFYDLKKGKGTLKAGYKLGEISEGTRKALGIQQYNVVKGSTGFKFRPAEFKGAGDGRIQTRGSGYNEGTSTFAVWKDPNYKPPAPAKPKAVATPTISDEAKQYRADTLKIMQQADERMKAFETQRAKDEAARVEREKIAAESAAARSANQMRAGQSPNIQLQPASQPPMIGGTQPFKRRKMQIGGANPYQSLAISSLL